MRILSEAGIQAATVPDLTDLLHRVKNGYIGALLITAEAFSTHSVILLDD